MEVGAVFPRDLVTQPDHDRLSLLALLGMVNYTAQWVRPEGRLSAGEIADGYCAIVLS